MKILDTIERALFGASAAEAVEMRVELAARRIERRIIAALEQDEDDSTPEDPDKTAENASA